MFGFLKNKKADFQNSFINFHNKILQLNGVNNPSTEIKIKLCAFIACYCIFMMLILKKANENEGKAAIKEVAMKLTGDKNVKISNLCMPDYAFKEISALFLNEADKNSTLSKEFISNAEWATDALLNAMCEKFLIDLIERNNKSSFGPPPMFLIATIQKNIFNSSTNNYIQLSAEAANFNGKTVDYMKS